MMMLIQAIIWAVVGILALIGLMVAVSMLGWAFGLGFWRAKRKVEEAPEKGEV